MSGLATRQISIHSRLSGIFSTPESKPHVTLNDRQRMIDIWPREWEMLSISGISKTIDIYVKKSHRMITLTVSSEYLWDGYRWIAPGLLKPNEPISESFTILHRSMTPYDVPSIPSYRSKVMLFHIHVIPHFFTRSSNCVSHCV